MESKSRSGCLKLMLILGGVFVVGVFFFALLVRGLSQGGSGSGVIVEEIHSAPATVRDRVARIDIEGMISSAASRGGKSMVDDFKSELREALDDKRVKAIVVRVNSPGGEVTASDVIYKALKDADVIKPVIVYMDTLAASGGYYVACAGRHVMAAETTLTGSIGVIMQGINVEEMLGKIGLEVMVFKSGEFKDMFSPAREMTDSERDYIQAMVGETFERFLDVVAGARGIAKVELRASQSADGRVFTGARALEWGMIDATGYIEDAYQQAMTEAGIEDASIVRYRRRPGLFESLGVPFGSSDAGDRRVEVRLSPNPLPEIQAGVPHFLYLPQP